MEVAKTQKIDYEVPGGEQGLEAAPRKRWKDVRTTGIMNWSNAVMNSLYWAQKLMEAGAWL